MKNNYQRFAFPKSTIFFLIGVYVLTSCSKETGTVTPENQYLLSATQITEVSKEQLSQQASEVTGISLPIKSGVKVYKIVYRTKNTDSSDITASGALILPSTTDEVAMISIQHGTILSEEDAPSNYTNFSESVTLGAVFGGLGYIISYPDYIGYGESKNLPHPYEHRASLASSSLDMLRAAREFLGTQNKSNWNDKLYLAGYSEGGYATMCLQKKLEEEIPTEFNLIASSCGAGAYHKSAFMTYLLNSPTLGVADYNSLYLWVLLTYDRIYKLNRPATYYFKEPYATQIARLGKNAVINKSFNEIITDTFKTAVSNGSETGFIAAINDNNVFNWKPKVPTRLFHGTADPLVFYFNSEDAEAAMKKAGAPDVQLIPIPGGTHSSSVSTYLLGTYSFFSVTK